VAIGFGIKLAFLMSVVVISPVWVDREKVIK